ncbi:MAG: protease inhibitor I42 family protein [Planctomycetota bacterium]|jgi:predicted secreted protein
MNRRIAELALLLVAVIPATACSGEQGPEPIGLRRILKDGVAEVKVGDVLIVSEFTNASTGYSWHFEPWDTGVLKKLESEYESGGDAPGSGGFVTFRWEAAAPGRTELHMKYCRDPKAEVRPEERIDAIIIVHAKQ